MKISTKIILGYALLILLMVTALIYELALVHQMQVINQNVSSMKSQETLYSLRADDMGQVFEFIKRLHATKDPDYFSQLDHLFNKTTQDLQHDLDNLQPHPRNQNERREFEKLISLWRDFRRAEAEQENNFAVLSTDELDQWLLRETKPLEDQLQRVRAANQAAIDAEVEQSAIAGQKAEFVSKVAAGIAVVLSFVVSFVVVHSISRSLKQLTSGARAVAKGELSYRLDASGNDNFSQVARDFNFMVSKLDERERVKRDYVSHVSHELKAPLAAMQETSRLLMEGIPGPVNERQKRLLGLTLECGQRLSKTIISLLDLSRMEADALDYDIERTDLREVIQSTTQEFEVQISQKGRSLQLELPPEPLYVNCDGDRIGQILSNLIDNALKFAPGATPIAVSLCYRRELPDNLPASWRRHLKPADTHFALIKVADRGRGVPDEHKELIFEKFHQVKFEKKIAGQGVGLGLVICRNIVMAHQGAIWVADNMGGGSVFYVLLPAEQPGVKAEPVTSIDPGQAKGQVQPART